MSKVDRATLKASADSRFPDQYAEDITPEDSREQAKDSADSHFNLTDDDHLIHLYHSDTREYKINDVIFKDGNFFKAITDHVGAFNIINWVYIAPIPTWTSSTDFFISQYVNFGGVLYSCLIDHTSTFSFEDDLAAGNWEKANETFTAVASGTDTYIASLSPALGAYQIYQRFIISFTNANTGACTLNIDSLGDIPIKKNASLDLIENDIQAGQIIELIYDGTNFQAIGIGSLITDTDDVPEGSTNKYYTDARVEDKVNDMISSGDVATPADIEAAVTGLWDDRGNHNASGNTFPSSGGSGTAGAILKGDIWTVSVAGTLGGNAVNIGDTVRALVDSPGSTSSNWAIGENNIGYVPENQSNKSSDVNADQASTTKYPSVKSVYDWAVGLFQTLANKDATGGYAGLTLFKINFKNAANTFTSFFTNTNTASRTYTFQDRNGTIADDTDLAGKQAPIIPTAVKTSNYSAAAYDLVPVDTTGGSVVITLPSAPADKTLICVKHIIQGGSNTVTVNCAGSDVYNKAGGATSATLSLLSQAIFLQYKASSAIWYVVADDLPLSQLDSRYIQSSGTNVVTYDNLDLEGQLSIVAAMKYLSGN